MQVAESPENQHMDTLPPPSQPVTPQVSVELKQIMLVLKNIQERLAALEQDVAELKAQGPQHPQRKADDPYHPESKIPRQNIDTSSTDDETNI